MEKVTICTNWDGSDFYPVHYIDRLYRACLRNTFHPFDFVVYTGPEAQGKTGSSEKAIQFIPVDAPYWWSKCWFWKDPAPGVNTETRLWIDLDVVIVGSLDTLIEWPSDFCCTRDYASWNAPAGHENDANDGVCLLRGKAGLWAWEEYVKAGMPKWKPFDRAIDHSPLPLAMMTIINDHPGCCDLWPQDVCASYKFTVKKSGIPKDCATVHFHGQPKQGEADEVWIREYWK